MVTSRMLDEALRVELIAMRAQDLRVRQELVDSGELGGSYVPRMEAVHVENAERLKQLIAVHGWPDEEIAGKDGAGAAWFIVQHAVGDPKFQRACLALIKEGVQLGRVPGWHAAYLEDRIAMQEGRPQRYGTQWLDSPIDGRTRPWQLVDAGRVNEFRNSVGLGPLPPIPKPGPPLPPQQQQAIENDQRWWEEWFASKGWRPKLP